MGSEEVRVAKRIDDVIHVCGILCFALLVSPILGLFWVV